MIIHLEIENIIYMREHIETANIYFKKICILCYWGIAMIELVCKYYLEEPISLWIHTFHLNLYSVSYEPEFTEK